MKMCLFYVALTCIAFKWPPFPKFHSHMPGLDCPLVLRYMHTNSCLSLTEQKLYLKVKGHEYSLQVNRSLKDFRLIVFNGFLPLPTSSNESICRQKAVVCGLIWLSERETNLTRISQLFNIVCSSILSSFKHTTCFKYPVMLGLHLLFLQGDIEFLHCLKH